eukprot:Hpha_TRINITY_DN16515_c1_g9::TRINITY_DN16515_c1_g9_i1::g.133870::m.133870
MQRTTAECTHRFPFSWEDVIRAQERAKMKPMESSVRVEIVDDDNAGGTLFKYTVQIPWWARALLPAEIVAFDRVTQDAQRRKRTEVLTPGTGLAHIGRGSITTSWEPCSEDVHGATLYKKHICAETRIPQAVISRAIAWYLRGCEGVWRRCEEDIAAELAANGGGRKAQLSGAWTGRGTPTVRPRPRSPLQFQLDPVSSVGSQTSITSQQFETPPSTPQSGGQGQVVRIVQIEGSPASPPVIAVTLPKSGGGSDHLPIRGPVPPADLHVRTTDGIRGPPPRASAPVTKAEPEMPARGYWSHRRRVVVLAVLLVFVLAWGGLFRPAPSARRHNLRFTARRNEVP